MENFPFSPMYSSFFNLLSIQLSITFCKTGKTFSRCLSWLLMSSMFIWWDSLPQKVCFVFLDQFIKIISCVKIMYKECYLSLIYIALNSYKFGVSKSKSVTLNSISNNYLKLVNHFYWLSGNFIENKYFLKYYHINVLSQYIAT